MLKSRSLVALCCVLTLVLCCVVQVSIADLKSEEEADGRKYAREIEEQEKLVDDPAMCERVERVGQELAKIALETEVPASYGSSEICDFKYSFKVIEDEDVNAFSLPGGFIYVNTGLLNLVESDDELAGVIAHEIAHSAHHHVSHLMTKQSKVDRYVALAALVGILGDMRSNDLNNLLMGIQMYRVGKMSSFTQEAEVDADRTAVSYLAKSPYNPQGLVTFMRKLQDQHKNNPTLPLGIFQTHPAPHKRVASITEAMTDEGITFNARKLKDIAYANVVPVEGESDRYQVVISKRVLFEPASLPGSQRSRERAEIIAQKINDALDSGLSAKHINCDEPSRCLIANGLEILKIEDEDCLLAGCEDRALLDKARSTLAFAAWADWLCGNSNTMNEEYFKLD